MQAILIIDVCIKDKQWQRRVSDGAKTLKEYKLGKMKKLKEEKGIDHRLVSRDLCMQACLCPSPIWHVPLTGLEFACANLCAVYLYVVLQKAYHLPNTFLKSYREHIVNAAN